MPPNSINPSPAAVRGSPLRRVNPPRRSMRVGDSTIFQGLWTFLDVHVSRCFHLPTAIDNYILS